MTRPLRNTDTASAPAEVDYISGRGDPEQKFRLYRLCECGACEGSGKEDVSLRDTPRCPECRGEGKTLELLATCPDPQALGVAIVQLGEEGEFDDCPLGVLIDGGGWLVKPWLPSTRNVSDAAKLLARSKTKGER